MNRLYQKLWVYLSLGRAMKCYFLNKSIYHSEDGGITLWFWQTCDEFQSDVGLETTGSQNRLEQARCRCVGCLIGSTDGTSGDEFLYIVEHRRPQEALLQNKQGSFHSGVTTERGGVTPLDNCGLMLLRDEKWIGGQAAGIDWPSLASLTLSSISHCTAPNMQDWRRMEAGSSGTGSGSWTWERASGLTFLWPGR